MGKKKSKTFIVKLVSAAGTGFTYMARRNPANLPNKMQFIKFDPIVRQHVLFKETKSLKK